MAVETTAATKALRAALEQECRRRLEGLGFRPARKPSSVIDLSPEFLGIFIPIWKPYSRHVVMGLSPHVGVIDLELEAEINRRGGRLAPGYSTYQTPLINIVPGRTFPQGDLDILFDEGDEGRKAMDWFVETMAVVAIPWMHSLASDDRLATEIFRLDDLPGTAVDFRLGMEAPLLELRFDRPERALARLDRHVAAMESRRDAIGDGYRAFAAALRREIAPQN